MNSDESPIRTVKTLTQGSTIAIGVVGIGAVAGAVVGVGIGGTGKETEIAADVVRIGRGQAEV